MMAASFNPAALHALETALDDPLEVIQVDELDLLRIGGEEARTKCATLRLASTMLGVAMASRGRSDDEAMLQGMNAAMGRLAALRTGLMAAVGVDRADADYPAVFNAVTKIAMGLVRSEWVWQKLVPERPMVLTMDALAQVLDSVVRLYPERYELEPGGGLDLPVVRRLMAYACTPSLHGLVSLFDYFQRDRNAMVKRLMRAVADQAERHIIAFGASVATPTGQRAIVERMYGASLQVMVETYKGEAQRDVVRLREATPLDRSIQMLSIERHGGMDFDHVIDAHREAMDRMTELVDLINQSQGDNA